jgi:hypothetical protein
MTSTRSTQLETEGRKPGQVVAAIHTIHSTSATTGAILAKGGHLTDDVGGPNEVRAPELPKQVPPV